jgi:hypothetical protein
MSNHFHILIETPASNLSGGMRQLNGLYTQRFIIATPSPATSFKAKRHHAARLS